MEADLRRFYGLSLHGDFWSGRIEISEMVSLVKGLPPEASLCRLVEPRMAWGPTDYLLADAVDCLAAQVHMFKVVNFKGSHEPPEPIRRPGEAEAEPEFATIDEARSVLAGLPRPGEEVAR